MQAFLDKLSPSMLMLISACFFVLCDYLAASWGKTGSTRAFLITLLLAPIGYLLFGILNQTKDFAVASVMVNLSIVAMNAVVGYLIFKEILGVRDLIGLGMAGCSIFLLSSR